MAAHLLRRAEASVSMRGPVLGAVIEVAGDSLGAALATYHAAENALVHKFKIPRFARCILEGRGSNVCWRLTDWPYVVARSKQAGIVRLLPPLFSQHVNTEQLYDSDNLFSAGFGCWHALTTSCI